MMRGYRGADLSLLTGPWLAGELLGLPPRQAPALAGTVRVAPPVDHTAELCVVPGVAFVRFAELDWVNRRARLEIGVRVDAVTDVATLLTSALAHGFQVLNLHRVYGWVTPAADPPLDVLTGAGLRPEATVPGGYWLDGAPVERQIWGAIRHD